MIAIITHWSNSPFAQNGWTQLFNVNAASQNGVWIGYKKALAAEPKAQQAIDQGRAYGIMWEVLPVTGIVGNDIIGPIGNEDIAVPGNTFNIPTQVAYAANAMLLGLAGFSSSAPNMQAPTVTGTGVVIDGQTANTNISTAGGITGFHSVAALAADPFSFTAACTLTQLVGQYGTIQVLTQPSAIASTFKNVITAPLYTGKTDYAFKENPWQFDLGAPWPQYCRTREGAGGGAGHGGPYAQFYNGGLCDVFYNIGDTLVGVDYNTWGSQVFGALQTGNPCKWFGDILKGFTVGQTGAATSIDAWCVNLAMPLGSGGVNFPTFDPSTTAPFTPNFTQNGSGVFGAFMSVLYNYASGLAFTTVSDPSGISTFGKLSSDGSFTGNEWLETGNSMSYFGQVPGSQFYTVQTPAVNVSNLGILPLGSTIAQDVTKMQVRISTGVAAIDNQLFVTGSNTFASSGRMTAAGVICYCPAAVTLNGITYPHSFILFSPNMLFWWLINMDPKDAGAVAAWNGADAFRSAVITPDLHIFMSAAVAPASVFVGTLNFATAAPLSVVSQIPAIPLPVTMGLGR